MKLADITNEGCPVAQPKFNNLPSANTNTLCPSGNKNLSYCGLILIYLSPLIFFNPAMSISLSK